MYQTDNSVTFTDFDEVSGLSLIYGFALHRWKIKVFGFNVSIQTGALKRLILKHIGMKSSGTKKPIDGKRILRCHDGLTRIGFLSDQ